MTPLAVGRSTAGWNWCGSECGRLHAAGPAGTGELTVFALKNGYSVLRTTPTRIKGILPAIRWLWRRQIGTRLRLPVERSCKQRQSSRSAVAYLSDCAATFCAAHGWRPEGDGRDAGCEWR